MNLTRRFKLLLIGAMLAVSGCGTVNYDQVLDQQITSVTQEGDEQLSSWQNALASKQTINYDSSEYGKVIGDLQALKVRIGNSPDAETVDLSPIVDSQVALWGNIQQIQSRDGFTDAAYLKTQEDIFNYNMGLLTQYELALKGGSSTAGAASKVSAAKNGGGAGGGNHTP